MGTRIRHRRDNVTNWTNNNPIIGSGEIAYNTTDGSFRIGDGTNTWSALPEYQYGALHYMGTHDASSGSYPSLPEQGQYYVISVAGTMGGVPYVTDDWCVYNGIAWNKINNQAYQPLDNTLTALAGLSTSADTLPYFTGADTVATTSITEVSRSLIGCTTTTEIRDLIGATSSTIATTNILVYDGTPSESDLSTYDEIYTSPSTCFAALPAIINNPVTITIREADGSAYAASKLQRVVAGGSITIQGEYYWNNTIASAGSSAGKFNVNAADTGVQAGDKILLIRYSGSVGTSTPTDAFVDTVSSVSGTEITLTDRITDAFDTTWRYVIVRTVTGAINANNVNLLSIYGLNIVTSSRISITNCKNFNLTANIINSSYAGIVIDLTGCDSGLNPSIYNAIISSASGVYGIYFTNHNIQLRNLAIFTSSSTVTNRGLIYGAGPGYMRLYYSFIKCLSGGKTNGVYLYGGFMHCVSCFFDGYDPTNKMSTALYAIHGGNIKCESITFGSNITTQKTPANWASTTDGSYIS